MFSGNTYWIFYCNIMIMKERNYSIHEVKWILETEAKSAGRPWNCTAFVIELRNIMSLWGLITRVTSQWHFAVALYSYCTVHPIARSHAHTSKSGRNVSLLSTVISPPINAGETWRAASARPPIHPSIESPYTHERSWEGFMSFFVINFALPRNWIINNVII